MRDAVLFIFRAVLGIVFIAHGWQMIVIKGLSRTASSFDSQGVPQPKMSAYLAAIAELGGGAFLVVGFLTTIAAGILAIVIAGALYFVHLSQGFFAASGGFEYVLVLLAGLLLVVVFGAGRWSVDGVLSR